MLFGEVLQQAKCRYDRARRVWLRLS
jgi:hypothetical protein